MAGSTDSTSKLCAAGRTTIKELVWAATISRYLTNGLVTAQPKKRPKSSHIRFPIRTTQ
jgi:hypothetical protein